MLKAGRGLTVLEMIVVTILIFLIFYYIYKMLSPGIAAWRKSEIKVSLQQNTMVALYRLKNELEESNVNTVTLKIYNPSVDKISTLICFASPRDKNGIIHTKWLSYAGRAAFDSGVPDLQKYVIYYLDAKFNLRRSETSNYTNFRSTDSMQIRGDPKSYISIDNLMINPIIARQIEELTIRYNPNLEEWRGGIDISISAVQRDLEGVEQFRTNLETTFVVKYDDID